MVRFKNRWLLVEFIPTSPLSLNGLNTVKSVSGASVTSWDHQQISIDQKRIWAAVKQSVLSHFGDIGWGTVGLSLTVKYFSPVTNICIIRVARDHHKIAWGAVTMLDSIDGVKCIPHVIHVSGTIKHAQLAAVAHNREVVARYRAQANAPVTYQDSYNAYLESSTQEIESLQD